MELLVTILAVFLGLLGGLGAGLWLGKRARGQARRYWALNAVAVIACMLGDLAGLSLGWPWLAYGSLGVMGGAITGLKYGYTDTAAMWRTDYSISDTEPLYPAEQEPEAHDDPAAG